MEITTMTRRTATPSGVGRHVEGTTVSKEAPVSASGFGVLGSVRTRIVTVGIRATGVVTTGIRAKGVVTKGYVRPFGTARPTSFSDVTRAFGRPPV